MKITVVGTGYVGLIAGTCLADLGHEVLCMDTDARKVRRLRSGDVVIYEPGLTDLFTRNLRERRLRFTTSLREGVAHGEVLFLAVGTPPGKDYRADIHAVCEVGEHIGTHMTAYKLVVVKSTVPVGTCARLQRLIRRRQRRQIPFDVASNPEFLREGQALKDFVNPDRIVVGTDSAHARALLSQIYRGIVRTGKPILFTDVRSSELIKYASNAFLATKISFINELARFCEAVDADVKEVAKGLGLDERIGPRFLQAGVGYGGSCFPKDVKALMHAGRRAGCEFKILREVDEINREQRTLLFQKMRNVYPRMRGKRFAMWGLAFKPGTDDMREAPSITLIQKAQRAGATIVAFDPVAQANARRMLKGVVYRSDPYAAVKGCDGLFVVTDWNEFRELDLARVKRLMRRPVIIDGRNLYEPEEMQRLGIYYDGVGRRRAAVED